MQRCMPENLFFREPTTQNMLLDILFIYCKLNADVGYRQGMHEILAPIVWVISRDAIELQTEEEGTDSSRDDHLLLSLLSRKHIEHDSFTVFGILMQTARSFYETASNKPQSSALASVNSPIVERSQKIHEEYLQRVDPELAAHLNIIDILPQIFVMYVPSYLSWCHLSDDHEYQLCNFDIGLPYSGANVYVVAAGYDSSLGESFPLKTYSACGTSFLRRTRDSAWSTMFAWPCSSVSGGSVGLP